MIQFEHIEKFCEHKTLISEMSQKRQRVRPQREHLKTPIPQAGNYSLAEKLEKLCSTSQAKQTQTGTSKQSQGQRQRQRQKQS